MISEAVLSAASVRASRATSTTPTAASGTSSRRPSARGVTRRQASTGPMPASSTSTIASGVAMRLNQGGPTVCSVPVSASEISGKNVPHRITRQSPTSTRLLSRKKASRESSESSRASERRSGRRLRISTAESPTTAAMKIRNCTPIVDAPKAWIESRMPLRTRKVPSSASVNVAQISDTFQIFSMPRFSCTMIECRNAVPTSQGISEAFSTGSQAQ